MKEIFKTLIQDFIQNPLPEVIERDITIPYEPNMIVSIVGARRTGKTFFMFSLIKFLRKKFSADRLVYINLEDDRLWQNPQLDISSFRDAYYELYPQNLDKKVWLFFDEVQAVDNWERFIRRLLDTENCYVYITGSSSSLMSKEISTLLRGRTLTVEVFPFSFKEYLRLRKIKEDTISTKGKTLLQSAFNEYLEGTSLPMIMNLEPYFRNNALKDYLDLILYKDIAERFKVDNYILLKRLLYFLISNSANLISINKIYQDFHSQGITFSRNTLYQYISYLELGGIIHLIPIFNNNIRIQARNPYKVFAIDFGLRNLISLQPDKGRNLETMVYWELKRKNRQIYYWKNGQETDFVFQSNQGIEIYNVFYAANEVSTLNREIASVLAAMKHFQVNNATLITSSWEKEEKTENGLVKIIPFWKWAIEYGEKGFLHREH